MAWVTDDSYDVSISEKREKPSLPDSATWIDSVTVPFGWTVDEPTSCDEGWYKPDNIECYVRGCSKRIQADTTPNQRFYALATGRLECARAYFDYLSDLPPVFDVVRRGFMGDESVEFYNSGTVTTFIIFRKGLNVARNQTNAGTKSETQRLARDFANELFSAMP